MQAAPLATTKDDRASSAPPSRVSGGARRRATSAFVIAARVTLLLLAITATVSAFALHGRDGESSGPADRYVCPMHPEVTSATPSECPICRMKLERVARPGLGESAPAGSAVALTPHDDSVAPRSAERKDGYVCPIHPDVAADEPSSCSRCGMPLESVDKTTADSSAAKVSQTFSLTSSASSEDFKVIGKVTRRSVATEVRAPAWVETEDRIVAVFRKDELIGLSRDEAAQFFRAKAPSVAIAVQLTADPTGPQDGSTVKVHVRPGSAASKLEPGETGWVELARRARELLLVPSGSVLYSPRGPYVLVARDDRTFSVRHVEIGSVARGLAVVLSGLHEGERIAVGSAFSLDAERRLAAERAASDGAMP